MNLSSIVTRIKLKLGLVNLAMPFDDIDLTSLTLLTGEQMMVLIQGYEVPLTLELPKQ